MGKGLVLLVLGIISLSGVARASSFGAISYSPSTGRVGESWGKLNRYAAETTAYAYCGVADCRTAAVVFNSCAAVAVGSTNPWRYGWGVKYNLAAAQVTALQGCALSDYNCRIVAQTCSF